MGAFEAPSTGPVALGRNLSSEHTEQSPTATPHRRAASKNGAARYQSEKVRVAIIGVGNCASSFVQGVHYYRDADPDAAGPRA